MPPAKPHGRVTLNYRFAGIPHALIFDARVSPLAFRLWCVLCYLDWSKEPPSVPILQKSLQQEGGTLPTRRSIYRWLSELEEHDWLEWTRAPGKAGINDRITLKTHGKPVTTESQPAQPVIVESQPGIVGSQVAIVGSQVDYFQALSEPLKNTPQTHEKIQKGGGGGARAPGKQTETIDTDPLIALFARYDITQAEPLARLYREKWPDITLDALTRLCERLSEPDAGSYAGARLYRKLKAGPYERRSDSGSDRNGPRPRAADRPADPDGATTPERGPVRTTLDY